jgi:peptidase M10/serralysin-like protein
MSDFAEGGNDTFTGASSSASIVYGDAGGEMSGHARGGDDVLLLAGNDGPFVFNKLAYGDALTMSGNAVGGNDTLAGGSNSGAVDLPYRLYGDAGSMSESAQGGNDTLTGSNNAGGTGTVSNILFGDAESLSGSARGGNDTLFAGTAVAGSADNNEMWGDEQLSGSARGGADLFVFKDEGSATVGTRNTIEDFSQGQQDKIEFSGVAGVQSFADLIITQLGTDTAIAAGADQVTLHNFTSPLSANDFLFT